MNNSLAPTYQHLFGHYWVLWFQVSNIYSVVETQFKTLLDIYFQSDTKKAFIDCINNKSYNSKTTLEAIDSYLKNCNNTLTFSENENIVMDTSNRNILKQYAINGKTIQIYFDSELVLKTVHPALAHLHTDSNRNIQTTFDIYLSNEYLYLFKDEQLITYVPKRDYHLIQGKFIMQLLCTMHDKEESEWIGTFHGSTITDGDSSILFVGESGKGKSTLCALLANKGFNLLADDVSPMLSENKNIYRNPSGISIKEGAFEILKPVVTNFEKFPIIEFNKTKGPIKYIPCKISEKDNYPCNAIVMVNYKSDSKTSIDSVSIKELLETLIPDSWLSPNPIHAQQFLDWLKTLKIYKLTYSDSRTVVIEISKLFKQFNKNL